MTTEACQTDVVTLCSGETQTHLATCDHGTQMETTFVDGATQTLQLSSSDENDSSDDDDDSSSSSSGSSTPIQQKKQPALLSIWGKQLKYMLRFYNGQNVSISKSHVFHFHLHVLSTMPFRYF